MKPNKPFCYTVFYANSLGGDVHEINYHSITSAEIFASFCEYATVYDNFTDEAVSYWQSGREV